MESFFWLIAVLAALPALYLPWLVTVLVMIMDFDPSKSNQTYPIYLPDLPTYMTYLATWPKQPPDLPINLSS